MRVMYQSFINVIGCRVSANKNIEINSFKSSEKIQKREGGPDRFVSDNQSSSVTLNEHELAMKAKNYTVISSFSID